jgi:hypothetical protein
MTEPHDRVDSPVEAAKHPVESAKSLAKEADRGRSARTPALAISGVTIVVAIAIAIVLAIAVIAYVLA